MAPVCSLGAAQGQRERRNEFVNSFVGGCYLANKQDDTDSACVGSGCEVGISKQHMWPWGKLGVLLVRC